MTVLTDSFGRKHGYLRISLTDRCNLRCTYCMPEEGLAWTPPEKILTAEEIIRLARIFTQHGIDKIRLTGGEPLLRGDLLDINSQLAPLPGLKVLAMTTNGIGLETKADALKKAGLTTLTISLDTLIPERFQHIAKRDKFQNVLKGIEAGLAVGFAPLKINIVVMKGINDDEIVDFIDWGCDKNVDLRFIEYMPFPDNHWSQGGLMPYAEMRAQIESRYKLIPYASHASSVGKEFQVAGYAARVSFVTSMTESFCSTCNRLRITADGNIKSCLFSDDERNLRDLMRGGGSDDDLIRIIASAVRDKQAAHAPVSELMNIENRAMIAVGG